MADALVSVALKKLINVIGQQLSLFAGATRELQKLSHTFQSIQEVLADAESRQASDDNVKQWLSRLKHVAYDIEDLVEDGRISDLGDEEGNEDDGNSRNKLSLCFPFGHNRSDYAISRYRIAHGIKEITERLDQIDVERNRFGFSRITQGGDDRRHIGSQRLTTSLMDESEMFVGRVHDKELMISRLVSGSSHEDGGQAHVVAIFGIGGLGKTTLARKIYHDGRVRGHFNKFLWVCVSDVFDVIRLTKEIIEEVKGASTSLSGLSSLQNELVESLGGKRFLLILDDVWNDDAEKWKLLQLPLNSGAQGSRILVTTRGQKVAETMNATYIHELQGLSVDDSWKVFRSRAFANMTLEECSKLEIVGRQIVSKCRGVPLAISVMGSAMSSKRKRTIADWQNILDSKMWSLRDAENDILPALWLSYYNLPSHLKQCFAYCSMFPKDWKLEKDMLVRLWAARGFILSDGNRDIEDIGADYFDDLVAWSMFQEVKENSEGKITCKMHDLLHDLAESIAKDEIYNFIRNSVQCPIASSNVRHSFLNLKHVHEFNKIPMALGKATKLRTLFLHRLYKMDKVIVDLFSQARFVRALVFGGFSLRKELSPCIIEELPKAISDLKHLRYLDLSGLPMVELPESVSHLRNLHRLNLTNCEELEKLPRGIGRMVNLRHLEIQGTDSLMYLPKGLGRISGLRSLSKFIVGGGDEGEGCRIDELQPLNSLQGTLEIYGLERVSSREEAEKAELWKKQHLCSLLLMMLAVRHGAVETERIDSLLEGLRPHGNLEELYLVGFSGSKLPSWMDRMRHLRKLVLCSGPKLDRVPHLPSLKEFQIQEVGNEILPDEGWEQLVALQILIIYDCKELKCLPEGLTQFPSLEQLDIVGSDKLESLPEGLGQLKKLKSLHVGGSEVLRCVPDSIGQLESLESLCISSCEKLESLPVSLGQLKILESLDVSGSEVLRYLPDSIGQLESLKQLQFYDLKKLESLPHSLVQLKKLESLSVGGVEVLRCVPDWVGQLESLEELLLTSFTKLESLPNSLVQLKKLKVLRIGGSEVLRCLPDWVGQLESLQELYINSCKKLESLPDSLGEKALGHLRIWYCEALASLPRLRHLSSLNIVGCPLLWARYMREEGSDWSNISHIPNTTISRVPAWSSQVGTAEAA